MLVMIGLAAMTTTYDPAHPLYLDEADVRGEMTRVFGVCNGCRACVDLCASFPTLFQMLERHADQDAGRLTPAQQDRVVDACVHCKRCADDCPYIGTGDAVQPSEPWELGVDVPRLMLRVRAMQHDGDITSWVSRATTQVIARADFVGKVATKAPALANRILRADPPFVKRRFSRWFKDRPRPTVRPPADHVRPVTLFPTCAVEYRETDIGTSLVAGYDARGLECSLSQAGCCGGPWLHAGHIKRFRKVARRNVEQLAVEVRRGTDVVVLQPGCARVIQRDYVDYVGGADAALVAAHTIDAARY
jgi:glycerol-3-phosphate dehydrogenase subunit C